MSNDRLKGCGMWSLPERIRHLENICGGLRGASRHTGIDVAYLKRMRDGEMNKPSDATLDKLGIRKEVIYVLK